MQSLNDTFFELDARIDLLKFGINVSDFKTSEKEVEKDFIKEETICSKIHRNVVNYKQEAIPRINVLLNEISEIESKGISIIKSAKYFGEDQIESKELKKIAYNNIKAELSYYRTRLSKVKAELEEEVEKREYTIQLPENFKIPHLRALDSKIKLRLNLEQTALLFHYLMDNLFIYNYNSTDISKIVSILTGLSSETLRQKGFGPIDSLKSNIPNSNNNKTQKTNLEILKEELLEMIDKIDADILHKKSLKRK